jgi:inner membrane protein
MRRSSGFRLFVVGVLALLMYVPLFLVGTIVDARSGYQRQVIADVGREWGGPQVLAGPVLVVPVEGPVETEESREVRDPISGAVRLETFRQTVTGAKAPLWILPETLEMTLSAATEERRRGIFVAPVYAAAVTAAFGFAVPDVTDLLDAGDRVLWDRAEVRIGVSSNAALRGEAVLEQGGAVLELQPRSDGVQGVFARVGDPRDSGELSLRLGLNGAESLFATPAARTTRVTIDGDWPHPSFTGAFLPDGSEVRDDGFRADWTIPWLARAVPQAARYDVTNDLASLAFGVRFFQPNDFYQKAWRAANYGILFLGLTFLTVFLIESRSGRPAHPVQYVLIGLAQAIFVLLMVAYAEQIGFGAAYLMAAAATVALITLYALLALRLGRRAGVLGLLLAVLYGVLYLILESTDYALIAGATLSFAALAATMWATRNEDWYGPGKQDAAKPEAVQAPPPAGP